MLASVAHRLGTRSPAVQSCRYLRAHWERGYLKDLYHRRQLLGADPLISRSALPNWNYSSEVYAFGHRIGAENVAEEKLVQALTTSTYYNRPDVEEGASGSSPSHDSEYVAQHNEQLAERGAIALQSTIKLFLRSHLPKAPEELIECVVEYLTSDQLLSEIARNIGVDSIIRTAEHPPSSFSIASTFRALVAAMDEQRARQLALDLVVPQLMDVDFADIFPLKRPLDVLTDLAKADGAQEIEPRLLRSVGEVSAQPVYVVGIYRDKSDIIGQSAGESIEVAVDMAAREGLLRLWGLTADRVFFFGDRLTNVSLDAYSKENYRLSDVCSKGTDLSLEDSFEDPLNIVEVAMRYKTGVEDTVGRSYTKRLRHKFSRGSLAKRSFRYLIKPKVYTVA